MAKLHIQIDTTPIPDDLRWLVQHIPPRLLPFQLDTYIHLNPKVLKMGGTVDNSEIFHLIQPMIDHSGIRQKAEVAKDDYLHLLIADKHRDDYLGIMYDYNFDPRFRQGCAVFWKPIKALAHSKDHFRAALLRTILHEIGHCLNLDHIYGGSVMTQTNQLGGGSWIKDINYRFDQNQIDNVVGFWDDHRPGTGIMLINQFVDQAKASTKIKVTLKTFSKGKRYQGDAISLLATLLSPAEQEIPLPTDPRSNNLRIWIRSPKQEARRINPMLSGCGQSDRRVLLIPNQEHFFPLHLFADNNGYLFDEPGTYRIHVSVRIEREEWISSNEITFHILIRKTLGPNAISIMYSPSILRFIGLGNTCDQQTISHVRQIIEENPSSEISRILLWTLACHIKISISKKRKGKQKKVLEAELLDLYQQLAQAEPSSVKTGKLINAIESLSITTGKAVALSDQDISDRDYYLEFHKKLIRRPKSKA